MLNEGVDVIFPVAGYAGTGAMEAVQQHGDSYSFGVDNDYSTGFPNTSIASLEKRVDVAIYAALMQLKNGIWNQNQKHFGIKQNVISIALNNNNPALTEADKQAVMKLVADFKNQNSLNAERLESRCSI
jgi:basic membrane protein A